MDSKPKKSRPWKRRWGTAVALVLCAALLSTDFLPSAVAAGPVRAPKPGPLEAAPGDEAVWFTGADDAEALRASVRAVKFGEYEKPFEQYLFETAERLDCYFTIERAANMTETVAPGRVRTTCSWFYLVHPPAGAPESIDDWVRRLDGLKGIRAVRDVRRPRVVHLIERSLIAGKGYPLDGEDYPLEKRVTGSFSGVPTDLPDALGRLAAGVASERGSPIGGFGIVGDSVTEVELRFENRPARDVLTDAVPPDGYMRQIWAAETDRWERGRLRTRVKFYGPKSSYGRDDRRGKDAGD